MFTAYIPIKLNSERIKNKNFLNINENLSLRMLLKIY